MEYDTERSDLSRRLEQLMDQAETEPEETDGSTPPSPPPDLSGLLGGMMSNPAMMQNLPKMMSALGPMLQGLSGSKGAGGGGHSGPGGGSLHRHTALLCAIKPYLCAERQRAADQLIGLCKMGDILPTMAPQSQREGGDDRV